MKGARSPLKKVQWLRIVLDEGHAIKNPNSQQTKAICELQAVRKWVLTGNNHSLFSRLPLQSNIFGADEMANSADPDQTVPRGVV